jgi:hypothetical protein
MVVAARRSRRPADHPAAELDADMPRVEPFWPAQLAAAVALALYVTLPLRLVMGPRWLVPGVEGILLVGLVVTTPTRHFGQSPRRRGLILLLLGAVSATTLASLILLAHFLLQGSNSTFGVSGGGERWW